MKGLLVKDFYLLWKYCRFLVVLIAVTIALSCLGRETMFFILYPCIFCGMVPMTLYAYDERDRWHVYAQTLPISKKQYVISKYLIGLMVSGAASFLAIVVQLIRQAVIGSASAERMLMMSAVMLVTMLALSLLPCALLMPFVFKLGAEKGRIVYFLVVGVVCGGSMVLSDSFRMELPQLDAMIWMLLGLCALAGIYLLSIALSVRFYEKREL